MVQSWSHSPSATFQQTCEQLKHQHSDADGGQQEACIYAKGRVEKKQSVWQKHDGGWVTKHYFWGQGISEKRVNVQRHYLAMSTVSEDV